MYVVGVVRRVILVRITGGVHVFVSIAVRKVTSELVVPFFLLRW